MITKNFLFLIYALLFSFSVRSQNCNCTSHSDINNDAGTDTVSSGQVLCIDSGSFVTGNIILNGGTICIKGVFSPASFTNTGGTINVNSNGVVLYSGDFNLGILHLNVDPRGVVNISGKLKLENSLGNISNKGAINVNANIVLNAGSLNNEGVLNYNALENGGGNFTNSGSNNARNN